jgi:DNA-directed RNA polymerase specialized sigma24 family protein
MTACADDHQLGRIYAYRADRTNEKLFDRMLVSAAFNQLQPLHREVIRRAYCLGWTTNQIAADLNITESASKSLLHCAFHTLRLILTDPTLRLR